MCELFLLEGLSVVSAEDSVSVDFSALEPFFELFEPFVPELEVLPVDSDEASLLSPVPVTASLPLWCGEEPGVVPLFAPRVDLDALALAAGEALAAALGAAVAEAKAFGEALTPAATLALGEAFAPVCD